MILKFLNYLSKRGFFQIFLKILFDLMSLKIFLSSEFYVFNFINKKVRV